MTCDDLRPALHEDLDGRLAARDRAALDAHLAACAACRADRAALLAVGRAFAGAPIEAAPPDLLAALGLADDVPEGGATAPQPTGAPVQARPTLAALPGGAGPDRRRGAAWLPLAGGLVAAALVAAVGFQVRPGVEPAIGSHPFPSAIVAMSPVPAAEAEVDPEAILTWFDADADYVEPLAF